VSVHTYRVVKQINGLGTIKFRVEQRVLFFFWTVMMSYSFLRPAGEVKQFETREGAQMFIDDRMRDEAESTWVRAK
jgi:hypothetical protein